MIRSLVETATIQEGWNPTTTTGVLTDFIDSLVSSGRIAHDDFANYLESRRAIGEEEALIVIGNSPTVRIEVSDIDWDDDDGDADLPETVTFHLDSADDEDFDFANALSDEYGFCVNSLSVGEAAPLN
ncbi:MAG: hypothetical protein CL472_02245 [Acidobacteria bacterium]|nr:hypothetical protein [Acidobacteriota bacterium]